MIVAIDGPAGAGKSTVARALARRLGIGYLNTGAMYRALTWLAAREGVAPDDEPALAALAAAGRLRLVPGAPTERVEVDGHDVTTEIREPWVTDAVSEVSAHRAVRRAMVAAQAGVLREGDWVADGRDVGSVVAPDAEVKVFLTATPDERARRRRAELAELGVQRTAEAVLADIMRRDHLDTTRAESPLVVAPGAVVLDSSELGPDEVVDALERMVSRARAGQAVA